MNILFDETVDFEFQKRFAQHHPEYVVSNVNAMGWSAGSAILSNLTAAQRDKLLLQLAAKSGFSVFITADSRFHRHHAASFPVIVCDAQDHAPTVNFWNAVAPLLDEQIVLFMGLPTDPDDERVTLRLPDYEPSAAAPVIGSRLASAKLRPSRKAER